MLFDTPLLEGRLLRRYKRFFADVELLSGELVTAHCVNPGSMKTCLLEGGRVWLTAARDPKRKLRFTWQLAEVSDELVFVNPGRANELVAEAIKTWQVPELSGYDVLQREVRVGERSRIDFLLSGSGRCYVEVKNVTLTLGAGRSAFPDSVTDRGTRHLHELSALVQAGHRAVLFFCAARQHALAVEAAKEIDPVYAAALRAAHRAGVEVIAYRCAFSLNAPGSVQLTERLEVHGLDDDPH
jgi:sugar fermentation stimulation protein A